MTEEQWLACKDLNLLLRFLHGKAGERKLRLFAVACCRRVPRLVREEVCRRAVDVAERVADGAARRADLEEAQNAALREAMKGKGWSADRAVRFIASHCARPGLADCGADFVGLARQYVPSTRRQANRAQISLLRDIFGNPFRPVSPSPGWRAPQLVALAQAAYDERELPGGTLDATRLAVLADALEEAGCTDPDLLGHLRGPGEHVRGCWAVDLLLGKG